MARIFITGSSDGLGLTTAQSLVKQGHGVVLHARSAAREQQAKAALPTAQAVVVGDLSTIAMMRAVAKQANRFGRFDAIIHNVGIGYREPRRIETEDGLSQLFAVNVLAPYLLTASINRPDRLVYLSSGMHSDGDPHLNDLQWAHRRWDGSQAYADTKLHDAMLAFAVARRWPAVLSNALEPGWVPTKMGGPGAPDDLAQGHVTQAWLATSEDAAARVTGGYFYHQKPRRVSASAHQVDLQDRLLAVCRDWRSHPLTPPLRPLPQRAKRKRTDSPPSAAIAWRWQAAALDPSQSPVRPECKYRKLPFAGATFPYRRAQLRPDGLAR